MRINNLAARALQFRVPTDGPQAARAAVAKKAVESPKEAGVPGRFARLDQLGDRTNLDRATVEKSTAPVMRAVAQQLDQATANNEFVSVQRGKLQGQDVNLMFRGANGVSAFYENQGQVMMQNGTLGADKKSVTWSPASPVQQAEANPRAQSYVKSFPIADPAKAKELIADFQNNGRWLSVPGMAATPGENPNLRNITIGGSGPPIVEREVARGPGSSTYVIDEAPAHLAQDYRAKMSVVERSGQAFLEFQATWTEPKPENRRPDGYERAAFNTLLDTVGSGVAQSINRASATSVP